MVDRKLDRPVCDVAGVQYDAKYGGAMPRSKPYGVNHTTTTTTTTTFGFDLSPTFCPEITPALFGTPDQQRTSWGLLLQNFLRTRCHSCRTADSFKALKE